MTYPRSHPQGDLTLSTPCYLPEPLASSSVKGGSGHPPQGCSEDLGGNDLESALSAANPSQMGSIDVSPAEA